jgi:hypothetical protein
MHTSPQDQRCGSITSTWNKVGYTGWSQDLLGVQLIDQLAKTMSAEIHLLCLTEFLVFRTLPHPAAKPLFFPEGF